jgi:hypothetical protein
MSNLFRGQSDVNPKVTLANGLVTVSVDSDTIGRRSYTINVRTGRAVDNSGEPLDKGDLRVIGAALEGSGLPGLRAAVRAAHGFA